MRTIAWSQRVGEVWKRSGHPDVEVVAEHVEARLVKLSNLGGETEWMSVVDLERDYTQAVCTECGRPLTLMLKELIDARRGSPLQASASYKKAQPGEYCKKPCCWPPHAPPTC